MALAVDCFALKHKRELAFSKSRDSTMDRITAGILGSFSEEWEIDHLNENEKFERLASYASVRRHYNRSFDIEDVVVAGGGDTGLDGVCVICNNTLATDKDVIEDQVEQTQQLKVSFIFVQATTSANFDSGKIGDFGFGVKDFFNPNPTQVRNTDIDRMASVSDTVFKKSANLVDRPTCDLYFVSAGKWENDNNLNARRDQVVSDLEELDIFSSVKFHPVGADELMQMYTNTKNAIVRDFSFEKRCDLPTAQGVDQAFLGCVPFSEFRRLIEDDNGAEIVSTIFDENVRDYQGANPVNLGIKESLGDSKDRSRFALMNNGVTVISRGVNNVASRFTLTDFQIVNGCQTSNALFEMKDQLEGDEVYIPLRLIQTRDEEVMDSIIRATNSQTPVKAEQYISRDKFARKLEAFFNTTEGNSLLRYERRPGQHDRGGETKTRVINQTAMIRSFASCYRELPHLTTRGYKRLIEEVGKQTFNQNHKLEPYYASALAHYLLEAKFFRTKVFAGDMKPARYHLLLAARLYVDPKPPSQMNSHHMKTRAQTFIDALVDEKICAEIFHAAMEQVKIAVDGNFQRDHVRTAPITKKLLNLFDRKAGS